MLASLIVVLPLIAFPATRAVPVCERADAAAAASTVDIEPRQWGGNRGGGSGGNRGRPTAGQGGGQRPNGNTAASGAASTAAGSQPSVAAPPVSAPASQPPAPSGTAGSGNTTAGTAAESAATGAGANGGSTGNGSSDDSAGTGTDTETGSGSGSSGSAAGTASGAESTGSTSTGTSNTGSGDGGVGGGNGPIGTGWDAEYNPADLSTYAAAGLQWWYNWQLQPTVESLVEYVPMVKGSENVPDLASAMANWPSGTQYVLSFNEPDQHPGVGGTAMTEADAARLHNEVVATVGGDYKISTPGVARGNFAWMDNWVAECEKLGGCKYDFVAYHYYGTDPQDMISTIKQFHEKYGAEVWLTEWACHEFPNAYSCSAEEAEAFMKTAIEWFRGEGSSIVTRWAWFGAFRDMSNWHGTDDMDGSRIANADGTVNAMGERYLAM